MHRLFPAPDSEPDFLSKISCKPSLRNIKTPPDPEPCRFCDTVLFREPVLTLDGRFLWWSLVPPCCTCPEATEEAASRYQEYSLLDGTMPEAVVFQAKTSRLREKSGLKKRFLAKTFAAYNTATPAQKNALATTQDYADNFEKYKEAGIGLYLEGTNGTGKTHLVAAITLSLLERGISVICKTSIDLLGDIKRAFDAEETSEYEILQRYKAVDLLIVDDLGKEQCTDWSAATLYSIINYRYEEMAPTIITTNFNEHTLAKNLTPKGGDASRAIAIISRLRETSVLVTMAWDDHRGKEGAEACRKSS